MLSGKFEKSSEKLARAETTRQKPHTIASRDRWNPMALDQGWEEEKNIWNLAVFVPIQPIGKLWENNIRKPIKKKLKATAEPSKSAGKQFIPI